MIDEDPPDPVQQQGSVGGGDQNDNPPTVGFHNFNLRVQFESFKSGHSLNIFLTRCRISMCQGFSPKKHDKKVAAVGEQPPLIGFGNRP